MQNPVVSGDSLKLFVKACVEEGIAQGSFEFGKKGGFYNWEGPNIFTDNQNNNFGEEFLYNYVLFYNLNNDNQILFPSFNQFHKNYEILINNSIKNCFSNFDYYNDLGYDVNLEQLTVNAEINETFSLIDVNSEVVYEIGNEVGTIKEFPKVKVPLYLGKMYEFTNYFLNYIESNEEIPYSNSYLDGLCDNYDFNWFDYSFYNDVEDSIVHYIIIKQNYKSFYEQVHNNDEEFLFMFAIKAIYN
ncbi:MAG: hypothetical protein ACOC3Z_02640 [Nanoarchaeota archaeon]